MCAVHDCSAGDPSLPGRGTDEDGWVAARGTKDESSAVDWTDNFGGTGALMGSKPDFEPSRPKMGF